MKKTIFLTMVLIILISCKNNIDFSNKEDLVKNVGYIKSEYKGNKNGHIVIFEESHNSRKIQAEIAVMLYRLFKNNNFYNIALEGFFEKDMLNNYTKSKGENKNIWFNITLELFKMGEISSAELLSLNFDDINVYGIENEKEYGYEINNNDSLSYLYYLIDYITKNIDEEQIKKGENLLKNKKGKEYIEYMLSLNEWAKKIYDNMLDDNSIEEKLEYLKEIENKVKMNDYDVQKSFSNLKNFYLIASKRSETMVKNSLKVLRKSKNKRTSMIIGAAHTKKIKTLLENVGYSYTVIKPISLNYNVKDRSNSDLNTDEYERKLKEKPNNKDNIGEYLNIKKPSVVIDEKWFQNTTAVMYLTTNLVRYINGGGDPPYNDDLLNFKNIKINKDSIKNSNGEIFFEININNVNNPLYIKALKVNNTDGYDISLFDEALLSLLETYKKIDNKNIKDFKYEVLLHNINIDIIKDLTKNCVAFSSDIIGIISNNKDIALKTKIKI